MNAPQRIIDANANRAREALRVLEESARFLLNDPQLSLAFKQLRHDLSQSLSAFNSLIYHRDTPGDVGTELSTASEYQRSDLHSIIHAAGARLSEALRVIEEYAKLLADDPSSIQLAKAAERLRYRSYELTRQLLVALGSGKGRQWRLCLLLTQSLCKHHPWQGVLQHAVAQGVDAVQVREKDLNDRALLQHVKDVLAIVSGGASVIVNDRPDIALIAGADGVHLGQNDLDPLAVRQLAGNRLIIGVSTANLHEARQAKASGADYCGVGPMFPTTTKHKPVLAGPAYLHEYLQGCDLPHLAIGGITPSNIKELTVKGCKGVAISSAICAAEDPAAVTHAILHALA